MRYKPNMNATTITKSPELSAYGGNPFEFTMLWEGKHIVDKDQQDNDIYHNKCFMFYRLLSFFRIAMP